MIDLRFPDALQIMLFLAVAQKSDPIQSVSSAQLAPRMALHASFVRKLLVLLAESDLVISAKGKNGGVRLARPAEQITLQEIYRSVIKDKKLWEARRDVPPSCLVTAHTSPFFEALVSDAETAVMTLLGDRTLAQSLAELEIMEAKARAIPPNNLATAL